MHKYLSVLFAILIAYPSLVKESVKLMDNVKTTFHPSTTRCSIQKEPLDTRVFLELIFQSYVYQIQMLNPLFAFNKANLGQQCFDNFHYWPTKVPPVVKGQYCM